MLRTPTPLGVDKDVLLHDPERSQPLTALGKGFHLGIGRSPISVQLIRRAIAEGGSLTIADLCLNSLEGDRWLKITSKLSSYFFRSRSVALPQTDKALCRFATDQFSSLFGDRRLNTAIA